MKKVFATLCIFSTLVFFTPTPALAAGIALNTSADYALSSGVSSQTFSYTFSSGANRFANICIIQGQGANTDLVSSVTVNGTAAVRTGNVAGSTNRIYDYTIVGESTGAQNVVVNFSASSIGGWVFIQDYTGVSQSDTGISGTPSNAASSTNNSATTLTVNLTTGTDNSWVTGCGANNAAQIAINKGVLLKNDLNVARASFDSNGPISPAAAYNVTWSDGGTTAEWQGISIEIKPAATAAAGFNFGSWFAL